MDPKDLTREDLIYALSQTKDGHGMSREDMEAVADYIAAKKSGQLKPEDIIDVSGQQQGSRFKNLAEELRNRNNPIPKMDRPSELAKFGMGHGEMISPEHKRMADTVEDATGVRPNQIYNPAMVREPTADTLSDVVGKMKDKGNAVLQNKNNPQELANLRSKVERSSANNVGKQIGKSLGKKILGTLPIFGGLASAAMSNDASAALGSLPVVGEAFNAEKLGEGSDVEHISPDQMQAMEAARMAREEDMLKPSRFNQLQKMIQR